MRAGYRNGGARDDAAAPAAARFRDARGSMDFHE
jgi:hypothetical protein